MKVIARFELNFKDQRIDEYISFDFKTNVQLSRQKEFIQETFDIWKSQKLNNVIGTWKKMDLTNFEKVEKTLKAKKPITGLTDKQCVEIAKILSNGIFERLSYVHRTTSQERVEIFFNNQEMKIDLRSYDYIDYSQLKPVFCTFGIENYLEYINFLIKNGFIQYS